MNKTNIIRPSVKQKNIISQTFSSHFLYQIWCDMHYRCKRKKNRDYKRYGGRGIKVCARWNDIKNFIADMEPTYKKNLTLDRINNDENYSPENCRWATRKEQASNRRNTRLATFRNRTYTLSEWSRIMDIPKPTLFQRINHGWNIERALTEPIHIKHSRNHY